MKKFIKSKNCLPFLGVCMFSFLCCLTACQQKKETKAQQTVMTISMHATTKKLYFSGTVEPLKKTPIITPVKGVVKGNFFKFGHKAKKGTLLFTINAAQQRTEYEETLTNYLKEKQKLNTSKTNATTSDVLYKQDIISRNEYNQAQDNYTLDQLSFIQSEKKLQKILHKRQLSELVKLSLRDLNAVIKALELGEEADMVKIYAPVPGVVLSSKDDS